MATMLYKPKCEACDVELHRIINEAHGYGCPSCRKEVHGVHPSWVATPTYIDLDSETIRRDV